MSGNDVELPTLSSHLWESANILRGPVDAADFKTYIFPLLFFKRISDVFDEEIADALDESGGDQLYALFPENHRFQIPDDYHWADVQLREEGKSAEESAAILNAAGFLPLNPQATFNRDVVRGEQGNSKLFGPGEWWIHSLADELGMAWQTLREWATNGWVHGACLPYGAWRPQRPACWSKDDLHAVVEPRAPAGAPHGLGAALRQALTRRRGEELSDPGPPGTG